MPWSGPADPALPENVKELSLAQRRQWLHIWESARAAGDDEGVAFRKANGAVKQAGEPLVFGGPGSGRYPKGSGKDPKLRGSITGAEADAYHQKAFSGWADSMTHKERTALQAYATSTYNSINSSLRKGGASHGGDIQMLDSAIEKGVIQQSTTLYGSLSPSAVVKLQPGSVFSDKGFVSTSINSEFGKPNVMGASIHIIAPAGTKAAFIGHSKIDSAGEQEMLLPRGSQFRIDRRAGNVLHATVLK